MLAVIEKLDPAIIDNFRKTGKSAALSQEVQTYIRHLDHAAGLYSITGNVSECARKLMKYFAADGLTFNTARTRIYDAIEHFHLNASVSNAAWDQYYADRFEDMARLAIASDDLATAEKCYTRAHSLRTRAKQEAIDPELLRPPVMLFSTTLEATDLKIDKKNLRDIAKKYEEGQYTQLIDKLPISEEEKQRLYTDAGIEDANIVEE